MTKIFFIGLSNKIGKESLAGDTISGALIDKIIDKLDYECIKTNLVNFAPIDEAGKLRYPNIEEKDRGFKSLNVILEKNMPYVAVCLGRQVSDYLKNKIKNVLSIQHPSYIAVYKRKDTEMYVENVAKNIDLMLMGKK